MADENVEAQSRKEERSSIDANSDREAYYRLAASALAYRNADNLSIWDFSRLFETKEAKQTVEDKKLSFLKNCKRQI